MSALQQRNRQLEEDLDSLKAKHAELQRGHEAQSRALAAARDEAATAESEAAAAGEAAATAEAARASVRQELDVERVRSGRLQCVVPHQDRTAVACPAVLPWWGACASWSDRGPLIFIYISIVPHQMQAALAQAQVARDAAVQQREAAAVARGELQERLAAAEASMDDSRLAAAAAAARHEEEAAEAAQLRARLADAEAAVAAAAADRVEAAAARGELQGELEALRKAAAVAEGKLVLARQRETQFKVGARAEAGSLTNGRVPRVAGRFPNRPTVPTLDSRLLSDCHPAGSFKAAQGAAAGASQLCGGGAGAPGGARGGGATVSGARGGAGRQ